MNLCKFAITDFIVFVCVLSLVAFVNTKDKKSPVKEIVVVGGGLAGMAAARRLMKIPHFSVRVLEARRERYGGRIWTNRTALRGIRGIDVELGAMMLNTLPGNDKLIQLAKEFELSLSSLGSPQLHFVDPEGSRIYSGEDATRLYQEAFQIAAKALESVKKEGMDKPVREVFLDAVDSVHTMNTSLSPEDRASIARILMSFPVTTLHNLSSIMYDIQNDLGWDKILVDGMDALLDRIVAGSGFEIPVKINLNKVVKNIEVDNKRKKVLVRTTDRKQIIADAVVVALPPGVLQNKRLVFSPLLPIERYKAVHDIGIGYGMRVAVGFDKAFWPKDVGMFNVYSELASDGFLQTWINAYKFSGNPFLLGSIFGTEATVWEKRPVSELKEIVTLVLSELFGTETVNFHNITTFMHSNWSSDDLVLGAVSYPKVGNSGSLWSTLQQPVCPYIYFAGAYTEAVSHMDSLHGAYNSGVRAAEQIINGVCKNVKPQKSSNKKDKKPIKSTQKKDEL